jgi:hypothetical protein
VKKSGNQIEKCAFINCVHPIAPLSRRERPTIHSRKREQIILHSCAEAESRTERIGPNIPRPEA